MSTTRADWDLRTHICFPIESELLEEPSPLCRGNNTG